MKKTLKQLTALVLALLLVFSLFFPLLSVYRFKQGCQD